MRRPEHFGRWRRALGDAVLCLSPAWGLPINAGAPLFDWCADLRLVERYHCVVRYLGVGTVRAR